MVSKKLIEEWIHKAEEDFGFASSSLKDSPYYAQICFHFQQTAEKYLKAFIVAHELDFQKSHDLLELLNICRLKEPSLSAIEESCAYLSRFYIDTRYPVQWPVDYTKEKAVKAQDAAKDVAVAIKGLVLK